MSAPITPLAALQNMGAIFAFEGNNELRITIPAGRCPAGRVELISQDLQLQQAPLDTVNQSISFVVTMPPPMVVLCTFEELTPVVSVIIEGVKVRFGSDVSVDIFNGGYEVKATPAREPEVRTAMKTMASAMGLG